VSDGSDIRVLLSDLFDLLHSGQERYLAGIVRNALSGSQETVDEFLVSNELWGGSGSIADQAFPDDRERRKSLEEILIKIGTFQIEAGLVNTRTKTWVKAFNHWKELGLR
jgi:hypothetical protein